ncbi:hypothetical protein GCM10027456_82990 [Kineosporia babensis]
MFDPRHARARFTRFRLQLFTGPGLRPVAVVTQAVGEGLSLTNGAERFAEAVWSRFFADDPQPPLWIQILLMGEGSRTRFTPVQFTVAGAHQLASPPRWCQSLSSEQLAQLVGGPVETGRGPYTLPQRPAEPVAVLEPAWVLALPRPDSDADRACNSRTVSTRQALLRQVWPRRGPGACTRPATCWYHGGDWHLVSGTALRLLAAARAENIAREDILHVVLERGRELVTGWEMEALESLLIEPIHPQREDGTFVNGRHRTRVMLETGVRRTLIE